MTTTRDWSAWYNRMPGAEDPNLYVSGVCVLASRSQTAELEFRPDGIVDEPDVLTLALVITGPEIGDAAIKECTVTWKDDVGPDIKTVRIRVPDAGVVSIDVVVTE